MSIPRELSIKNYTLYQKPISQIYTLLREKVYSLSKNHTKSITIYNIPDLAYLKYELKFN